MNKGKISQLKTGFKRVYPNDEVPDDDKLIEIITDVLFSAERYPFETKKIQSTRYKVVKSIEDTDSILIYLMDLNDKFDFEQTATYAKVFELCKAYDLIKLEGTVPKVKEVIEEEASYSSDAVDKIESQEVHTDVDKVVTESELPVSGEVEHENNVTSEDYKTGSQEPKEKTVMSNPIEQLKQNAAEGGVVLGGESNLTTVDQDILEASAAVIAKEKTSRIEFSNNTIVKKVVITQIDRVKQAINGTAAMGTVSNPTEQLSKFREKFDPKEDAVTKEVTFLNLHKSSDVKAARAIYDTLNEAVANPELLVQPHFYKNGETPSVNLKGIKVVEANGTETLIPYTTVAKFLLENSVGFIKIDGPSNSQLILDLLSRKVKGVVKETSVVKIANKPSLLEDKTTVVPARELNTNKQSDRKSGYKSELVAYYNSNAAQAVQGVMKKAPFRISLNVDQYEVVTFEEFEDLFGKGIGQPVSPKDISNPDELKKALELLSQLTALEASDSNSKKLDKETRNAINAEKAEIVKANAEANAEPETDLEDINF